MSDLTLLSLCGSLRSISTNQFLLNEAARQFGECTYIQGDIRLPLYDGDIETSDGIPAEVETLAKQIFDADAVILASPEYNKGISGALKNALDWVSRVDGNPWDQKPIALMSAAAGRSGGERAYVMMRDCLAPLRANIINGPEVNLAQSGSQWDEDGRLTNERTLANLQTLMQRLRSATLADKG